MRPIPCQEWRCRLFLYSVCCHSLDAAGRLRAAVGRSGGKAMLRIEDCKPGTLVQCIGRDDDLYPGEIYTVRKLHEPGYWTRDRRYVRAHSLSLEELPDNPNEAG